MSLGFTICLFTFHESESDLSAIEQKRLHGKLGVDGASAASVRQDEEMTTLTVGRETSRLITDHHRLCTHLVRLLLQQQHLV